MGAEPRKRNDIYKPKKKKKVAHVYKPKKKKKDRLVHVGAYSMIHIFFDRETKHLCLKYKTKKGKLTKVKNIYAASFVEELYSSLQKARKKGLLTTKIAVASYEEEVRISR